MKPLYYVTIALLTLNLSARKWTNNEGVSMEANFAGTMEMSGETIVIFSKDDGMRYQVPLDKLSAADQEFITSGKAAQGIVPKTENAETAKTRPKTDFEEAITKNLVRAEGSRISRVSSDDMAPKDYYAIYYSASWCPPCRKFTPKLVDFYKSEQRKNAEKFEIIYVSSDRSEGDMEDYIKDYDMAWPALDFDKIKSSRELTQFKGSGIPCLVLVDRDGKVLSHSYEGSKYVGPSKVMNDLKKKL